MDNMVQGNGESSKSEGKGKGRGKRSKGQDSKPNRGEEVVRGWDTYYRVACGIAWRRMRFSFPTYDDLHQAAALAATVARYELGEEARLQEVARIARRELYQQAKAYGWRVEGVRRPEGGWTTQTGQKEFSFAGLHKTPGENRTASLEHYLETRMMIVGVGEWTRKHAYFLYELLH